MEIIIRFLLIFFFYISSITLFISDEWKHSTITLLYKKDYELSNVKSYRPISISEVIGKLGERLIKNRLNSFVTDKQLLVDFQSGFREGRQTKNNIFFIVQKGLKTFNRNIDKQGSNKCRLCLIQLFW